MMKHILILSTVALLNVTSSIAQEDTLQNHAQGLPLSTNEYTGSSQWGFYSGMSHKKQEAFGERYEISEHGDVVGVIIHATGTVTNEENEAFVRILNVGNDGKPSSEVQHGHVHFHDINLDGSATVVMLDNHAHVHDAFFAVFDIGDYAHGGYEGDTIGILYTPDGSRSTTDLSTLYRNVVKEHGHGASNWIDFYTGNFTPIATHFAIYPIVEFEHEELGVDKLISDGILSFKSPYPNPANESLIIPFSLKEISNVQISVLDLTGKEILSKNIGQSGIGQQDYTLDLSTINSGHYIVVIKSEKGSLATKFSKK